MTLPFAPPLSPMLAELSRTLPEEGELLYEPKWDGFRTLVFRDGDTLTLESRNEKPMTRYFPEVVSALLARLPPRCVLDGEIVIAGAKGLDFDALLQRIHPAASRIHKLAQETPASLVAFDLLALEDRDLRPAPLRERRALLESTLAQATPPLYLTPATRSRETARDWFTRFEGAGLDGVIVKSLDQPYLEDERGWQKVKHERTADCVVGGFRVHKDGKGVGSLLLGLHDAEGTLHHVGVASSFSAAARTKLAQELEPLRENAAQGHPWLAHLTEPSDGQRIPGGPSRWTGKRDLSWEAVRPERVAEVAYDHLQGDRFRHATQFRRWRPDREPGSCRYDQLESVVPRELEEVFSARGK